MDDQTSTDESVGTSPGTATDVPSLPPARRLTRRLDQKVIGGVAAGLGEYFNVDPVVFRLGFVVLALLGGLGLVVYLVAWWIMPASTGAVVIPGTGWDPSRFDRLVRWARGLPVWVGIVLLILGVAILAPGIGLRPGFGSGGLFWGLALIALGVVLFQREHRGADPAGPAAHVSPPSTVLPTPILPPDPAPYPEAGITALTPARSWTDPMRYAPTGPAVALPSNVPTPPEVPPSVSWWERRRTRNRDLGATTPGRVGPIRERSPLGWVTVGWMLLITGGAAALQQTGTVHLRPEQFPALALLVLGLGLLVGAWWGRSRWLVLPGLLLIPFVLAASLIDVPFGGGFGERSFRPATAEVVRPEYRMVAGQLILDLRAVQAGQSVTVAATVVAGRLIVYLPTDVPVNVHARAGAGQVTLFGQSYKGLRVELDRRSEPLPSSGQIDLTVETSFGSVIVTRLPASGGA